MSAAIVCQPLTAKKYGIKPTGKKQRPTPDIPMLENRGFTALLG
jgi:hypothetical protein